jgi:adenylate cyclase
VVAVVAVIIVAAVVVRRGRAPDAASNTTPDARIAVLPFENAGPDSIGYLVDGLSETVITTLTQSGRVAMVPWMTVRRYRNTDLTLSELAQELGVQRLVSGSVRPAEQGLLISISLVDGRSGLQSWARRIEVGSLLAPETETAVTADLIAAFGGPEESGSARPTSASRSVEAKDWFWKGLAAMHRDDRESNALATACFERAVSLEPEWPEAHAALGATFHNAAHRQLGPFQVNLDRAVASFRAALAIDSSCVAAHRGLVRASYEIGGWEQCLRVGQDVARLALDGEEARIARAEAYFMGWLPDRAVPLCREITAVDPANQAALWFLVLASSWSGAFDECVAASEQYTRRFGLDGEVELWTAGAYECLGDTVAARAHFDNVLRLIPVETNTYHHSFAARFYLRRGDRAKAERIARAALASLTSSQRPDGELEAYPYHVLLRDGVLIERLAPTARGWSAEAHATYGDMERARGALRQMLDAPMEPWMPGYEAQMDLGRPQRLLDEPLWREYVLRRNAVRARALAEY